MGRSILFGLMLWQVAVLSLVLAGFSALLLWQIRRSAHEELERDLAGMAELLATRVHELSEGQSEASLAEWLGIPKWKAKDDRPYFAVYEAGGSLVAASASLFAPPPPPTPPRSLDKKRRPVFSRERAGALEVIAVQPSGTMVLVGKSMLHEQRREFFATMWIVGSAAGCLVLGVLGQALLARRAVRPIRAMAAAAGAIDFGNLAQRLDLRETRTELGELGHKFNAMLDRLQDAFERQTAFTADASHELRTPLAVIQAQIELALSRNRAPDEYRQALEACDRAA
ncbi:MAG: HAMP domain-containing protein, partial [Planctomycetota bacterium]